MKAVRIAGYNIAPRMDDVAMPRPQADEVLVSVAAASLNPLDVKLQHGNLHQYYPLKFAYTLGTDLAGTIAEIGTNVQGWRVGDKVIARLDPTNGGALAEVAAVPASDVAPAPTTITLVEAAGIPTAAGTAWQGLFEIARLQRGQTVLVHAGAGGVGSFAIQFARAVGARVIATASGDGIDLAGRLGADMVIDYRSEDLVEKAPDVDVVFDTIGGETQRRSYGLLRRGGTLLATSAPPDEALANAHDVTAIFVIHDCDGDRLKQMIRSMDADGIKVLVDRKMPLEAFDKALGRQASGRARGKIILIPG